MKKGFGLWLWQTRKVVSRMPMRQLSELTGYSVGMICDVENGKKRAGPETVLAILEALKVPKEERGEIILMAAKEAGWKL